MITTPKLPVGLNLGLLLRISFERAECGRMHRVEVMVQDEDGDRLIHLTATGTPTWQEEWPINWKSKDMFGFNFGLPVARYGNTRICNPDQRHPSQDNSVCGSRRFLFTGRSIEYHRVGISSWRSPTHAMHELRWNADKSPQVMWSRRSAAKRATPNPDCPVRSGSGEWRPVGESSECAYAWITDIMSLRLHGQAKQEVLSSELLL